MAGAAAETGTPEATPEGLIRLRAAVAREFCCVGAIGRYDGCKFLFARI